MMDSFLDESSHKCVTLRMETKGEVTSTGSGQDSPLDGDATMYAIAFL